MSQEIKTSVLTGRLKFTFTDGDDGVFSSFTLNPTDVNVANRCLEVTNDFENVFQKNAPKTIEDAVAFDNLISEKISYILGYDAKKEIFGNVSATTILPDGTIFAIVVLDAIATAIKPEIEKRKKAMENSYKKYASKYQ